MPPSVLRIWAGVLLLLGSGLPTSKAGPIPVPNGSFEAPRTSFVAIQVQSWQKAPRPEWYLEGGGFEWDQLVGLFKNPVKGSLDRITNLEGDQALWIFAVPEVGLFQDLTPSAEYVGATFQPGRGYRLQVDLAGSGGGMKSGVTLELGLYYRDDQGRRVPVASNIVTNTPQLFPTQTFLPEFTVTVPPVEEGAPWAGKAIGIQFLSTVPLVLEDGLPAGLAGGYWDVDHVRLTEIARPVLSNPIPEGRGLRFTLSGEPGFRYEILRAEDPTLPAGGWIAWKTVETPAGTVDVIDPSLGPRSRYYRAVQVP